MDSADRIRRDVHSSNDARHLALSLLVGRGATDRGEQAAGVDGDVPEMKCGDLAGAQCGGIDSASRIGVRDRAVLLLGSGTTAAAVGSLSPS